MIKKIIKKIFFSIKKRNSYSKYLIKNKEILIRKLNEECMELITEIYKNKKKKIINELCDLLYHLIIVIIKYKIKYKEIKKKINKPN
ncbi:phosphoribosyl-ATP diphosphatase [Candidatus Vidania fulgoroideorum]